MYFLKLVVIWVTTQGKEEEKRSSLVCGKCHPIMSSFERENVKEIEGKQALFVVNLEYRKMMGEESEGMIFDIGYSNGIIPVLSVPEKDVPNGVSTG